MIYVVKKGSRIHSAQVYIGRGSALGNPFRLKSAGGTFERGESIGVYREYLLEQVAKKNHAVCHQLNRIWRLAMEGDVSLVCYCAPLPCHGDVIKELVESKLPF